MRVAPSESTPFYVMFYLHLVFLGSLSGGGPKSREISQNGSMVVETLLKLKKEKVSSNM